MSTLVSRQEGSAPNGQIDADLAALLDRVCEQLPHDYTKQVVRDFARLKLWMGYEGSVRDYLKRRSGEFPAVPVVEEGAAK
jgi:hypothetical protein